MTLHQVTFEGPREDSSDNNGAPSPVTVEVPTGALLTEAARLAGIDLMQPCGAQGRCGRCVVQVTEGLARQRSTLRLSQEDLRKGYALACQSVVESDLRVVIPPQEKIERRLTTDLTASKITVPPRYDFRVSQSIQRVHLTLNEPSMDDQTDDWSRLQTVLRQIGGYKKIDTSLALLRKIGTVLREGNWEATAILNVQSDPVHPHQHELLIDLKPGHIPDDEPIWGAAIDIGTTTVTVWLVDLVTGEVIQQVSEYNKQIARGEDVVSRIVYASKNNGGEEIRQLVVDTINELVERACQRAKEEPGEIVKVTVAGNSTMMHLLLGIPPSNIRLAPFVTTVNDIPLLRGKEVGLNVHPEALVDCLPGVASYVGADITAGVYSSGMDDSPQVTLFLDVGTNGESVLGSSEWLVTCACSAGPAFEGAGVVHGMRATRGAIEEVWIAGPESETPYEPSYRVIGTVKPRGICGSGLISLLSELFLTGIIDKGGRINEHLEIPRVRSGEHGMEYVVAWGKESEHGRDVVITHVDIDNLLRAKAAIYAGFTVMADSVGVPLEAVEQILIGGSFGKYINVEKAIQIGLLPDMPWEKFHFLGNTSVRGAYYVLLDRDAREQVQDIAARMTYIELSADNTFYDAFMSALFLPHTDLSRFPTVAALMGRYESPTG
jgi:uncharacterized 2Fe-2S/4Fe-4S cluster protein (DUF4445 family)